MFHVKHLIYTPTNGRNFGHGKSRVYKSTLDGKQAEIGANTGTEKAFGKTPKALSLSYDGFVLVCGDPTL